MLRYLNRLRSAVKRKRREWKITKDNPREIWIYQDALDRLDEQVQTVAAIFRENPEAGKCVRFREVGE